MKPCQLPPHRRPTRSATFPKVSQGPSHVAPLSPQRKATSNARANPSGPGLCLLCPALALVMILPGFVLPWANNSSCSSFVRRVQVTNARTSMISQMFRNWVAIFLTSGVRSDNRLEGMIATPCIRLHIQTHRIRRRKARIPHPAFPQFPPP